MTEPANAAGHILDRPVWSALATHQAHFDPTGTLARRFPAEVGPFGAAADTSEDALAALAARIAPADEISLLEQTPPPAPDGIEAEVRDLLQMVMVSPPPAGPEYDYEDLTSADAEKMLALATLTKPGPFRTETYKFGRFIGIRDGDALPAMGGERFQPGDYLEISALCTHPDVQGRGYGKFLIRKLAERALAEGRTPFLHVYPWNTVAIDLYRRMGFEPRKALYHILWRKTA